MDDFLLRAAIAGLGLAVLAGPLGSFVVWRRMAYFGDTLAHSALLGVALGFLLGLNLNLAVLVICLLVAVLMIALRQGQRLADDTLLGILSHSTLATGLVALAFMESLRMDLMGYLFGDILAVSDADLWWIFAGGAAVLAVLALIWRPLLLLTVHEELARVEGVRPLPVQLAFTALIAVVVAIAMKMVGVLLVTALLIIPAAAARSLARSPEAMALGAAGVGCLSVALGLSGSYWWNLPSGPAVVVAAAVLFLVLNLLALGLRSAAQR